MKHSFKGTFEGVMHSSLQIITSLTINLPPIHKHKDIICTYTKHKKNDHLVQRLKIVYVTHVTVNEEGNGYRHDDLIHPEQTEREAPHVKAHPKQNEHDRRRCHCHVCLYHVLKLIGKNRVVKPFHCNTIVQHEIVSVLGIQELVFEAEHVYPIYVQFDI